MNNTDKLKYLDIDLKRDLIWEIEPRRIKVVLPLIVSISFLSEKEIEERKAEILKMAYMWR